MITVAYDESKGFERGDRAKTVPVMVAGIVYDDNGELQYKYPDREPFGLENMRIISYLRKVCDKTGGSFPDDLHGLKRQNETMDKELRETLPEFFKKGTYRGEALVYSKDKKIAYKRISDEYSPVDRKGEYQIVTILKKGNVSENNKEGVYAENVESGTYMLMIRELIHKGIFLNPYIGPTDPHTRMKTNFNVPTRVTPFVDEERSKEYRNKRYALAKKQINRETGKTEYQYRLIEDGEIREIVHSYSGSIRPVDAEFFIDSIDNGYSAESDYEKYAFLFLSDILVSFLKEGVAIKDYFKRPKDKEILERIERMNQGNNNMLFYLSDEDKFYDTARTAEMNGDIFEALSALFSGRNEYEGDITNYYSKEIFPKIEKRLERTTSNKNFEAALEKASQYSKYRTDDTEFNPRKLVYIFEELEKISHNTKPPKKMLARLYGLGVAAYNHIADHQSAQRCMEKLGEYEGSLEESEKTFLDNRGITNYLNQAKYDEAVSLGLELLGLDSGEDYNQDTLKQEFEKLSIARESVYKVISSLGQAYAFKNDNRAEICFKTVLDSREEIDDSGNIFFTMSLLMHWYIESQNKEQYEKYAKEYYGGNESQTEQFAYVLGLGKAHNRELPTFKFALFLFIKAFYTFYKDDANNCAVLTKLVSIDSTIKKDKEIVSDLTDHPWELIFKYAALLDTDRTEIVEKMEKSVQGTTDGMLDCIVKMGAVDYIKKKNELDEDNLSSDDEFNKALSGLWTSMVKHNFISDIDNLTNTEKYLKAKEIISYMYR